MRIRLNEEGRGNVKVNAQLIDIDGSPVNSVFGYYVGGQRGQTFSRDFSVLF